MRVLNHLYTTQMNPLKILFDAETTPLRMVKISLGQASHPPETHKRACPRLGQNDESVYVEL